MMNRKNKANAICVTRVLEIFMKKQEVFFKIKINHLLLLLRDLTWFQTIISVFIQTSP
jgi:hypothetical protein